MSAVENFLSTLKLGTRNTYKPGLAEFAKFYQSQGTIEDFIDLVQNDMRQTDWREKKKIAPTVLKEFSETLQKQLAHKSVRTYVAAVQSMLKFYLDTKISLFKGSLPPPVPKSRVYEWTLPEVGVFVEKMTEPCYQSFSSLSFQSALGMYEILNLEYQDIKEEYEVNMSLLCLDFGLKTRHKTEFPFLTFIGSWALQYLKAHLKGLTLQPETKLFQVDKEDVDTYFREHAKLFLDHWEGQNPMRPHSLRTAMKTLCTDAKVIDSKYVEFFMGHSKPGRNVEETYISKTRESWRNEYRKLEPFLTPKPTTLALVQT